MSDNCERYRKEPDCPLCCRECHTEDEYGIVYLCDDPLDEHNSVCCKIATWLRNRSKQ
jgi:hypothetical protein